MVEWKGWNSGVSALQPFMLLSGWVVTIDGDDTARAIFDRHYSRYHYADGRRPKLFVGPGEKMVLLRHDARALFAWRKFISADGQDGVCCAIFRNEGTELSSQLIHEADALADARWPGQRHYTYVAPDKILGTNPGCCFKYAGWRVCGITKRRKLVILERLPGQDGRV